MSRDALPDSGIHSHSPGDSVVGPAPGADGPEADMLEADMLEADMLEADMLAAEVGSDGASGGEPARGSDTAAAETEAAAAETEAAAAETDEDRQVLAGGRGWRGLFQSVGAFGVSMLFHAGLLLVLALWVLAPDIRANLNEIISPVSSPKDDELQEIELEENPEVVAEATEQVFSSSSLSQALEGAMTQAASGGAAGDGVVLDNTLMGYSSPNAGETGGIDNPLDTMVSQREAPRFLPDTQLGDARRIVDDYAQAMDQIAREILEKLQTDQVLVIWCFDESESMKDDQLEIRQRISHVYAQLGQQRVTNSPRLMSSVASYGEGIHYHLEQPTYDVEEIRAAIERVPIDISGKEMMCSAVSQILRAHTKHAKRRKVMLILVTDESGEHEDNDSNLERAVADAKSVNASIYTLGRESVFGYPYAYFRYQHPQTMRWHWLRVNRGPETGFVEQLQINGFRRRYDAFSSGFAPFEQGRMSRETGGIFFMLPSTESSIVRGERRRYELDALRPYKPDLRSRMEVLADRSKYPLRSLIWEVIHGLNPYEKQAGKQVEVRVQFALDPAAFRRQVEQETVRAKLLIGYMGEAQKQLESGQFLREQEADPRWQANYDLIYAQLVSYQARLFEYGAALEAFVRQPKQVPLTKAPNLTLVHWDIATRKELLVPEVTQPYIDQAKYLLEDVKRNHPGTPWAARADQELKRGYGVHLVPDYDPPYRNVSNPDPLPNY